MSEGRITYRETPVADLILATLAKYELEATAIAAWQPDLHRKYTPKFKPVMNHLAKSFWADSFEPLSGDSDNWEELFRAAVYSNLPITPDGVLWPEAYCSLDSDRNITALPSLYSSDILTDAVEEVEFLKVYYRSTEKFLTSPALEAVNWRTL